MQLNTASAGELSSSAPVPSAINIPNRLLRVERGGGVMTACFAPQLPQQSVARRGAKRLGILYEQRCQADLISLFGDEYVASPFLRYVTRGGAARHFSCIPDGLHIDWDSEVVTILEMKLKYTTEADWQTQALYKPIVERLFPDFRIRALVLCKYSDPATYSPFKIRPTNSVAHFIGASQLPYGLTRRVS